MAETAVEIRLADLTRRVEVFERMELDVSRAAIVRMQKDFDDMRREQKEDNERTNRRIDRNTQAMWGLMVVLLVVALGLVANLVVVTA